MAIATAPPLPSLLRVMAAPVCVAELVALPPVLVEAVLLLPLEEDLELDVTLGVPLSVLDVDVIEALGKDRDGLADAILQNCCESCSAEASSEGQVTDMQLTMASGNLPLYDRN